MAETTTKPAAQTTSETPPGHERVFLGYGPKNQYVINGKINVGGYVDMPNTTPAEQHRVADLKHRIAHAQVKRHEDDVVAGHDQSGEWPEGMKYDDFVDANRLQKLDHDRILAQQAKLAKALGQRDAATVVDAANAHIETAFANKARAEQLKVEGAIAQMAETQKQVTNLATAAAPVVVPPPINGLGVPPSTPKDKQ